jgi:hypothetical protein
MRRSIIALWTLAALHGLRPVIGPKRLEPKRLEPKPLEPKLSGPNPSDLS